MDRECKSEGCDRIASKGNELCHICLREQRKSDSCKYYTTKEKSVTVPWCTLRDCEVLSIDGSFYCNKCKKKEANND